MGWWTERWRAAGAAVLLGLASLCAQAEHVVLESYQEGEGLANLTPRCLVQDARAVLWICTENGLFRFDGFRVRAEPLPAEAGAFVYGGRIDAQGRLWAASEGGLFLREDTPAGPRWTAVRLPDGKRLHVMSGQQFAVDPQGVLFAVDEEHRIWSAPSAGTHATPLVVQRMALPSYPPPAGTADVPGGPLRWQGGALWFGCGQGLCEWRDNRLRQWSAAQGLPAATWTNLLDTRDGSLWARSAERLARLAPGAARFEAVAAPPRRLWESADATVEDRDGAILTASDEGIARWDGRQWREWKQQDGLPETAVRVLLMDAEGSLWFGASGRGIHRWVGYGRVEHWTRQDGLPSSVVFDVVRDGSGRLWAATRHGVAWFDERARRFVAPAAASVTRLTAALAVDAQGDLWWVAGRHLMRLRAGSTAPELVMRDAPLDVVVQGGGQVYGVGSAGLDRLAVSRGGTSLVPVGRGQLDPRSMIRVLGDGRTEWFVDERGIWVVDAQGRWSALHDEQGKPLQVRLSARADRQTLWGVDAEALTLYAVAGTVVKPVQRIPKAAFGGAAALFLRAHPDGSLWMGTDQGVFVRTQEGAWFRLDRQSGLVWNDVNEGFYVDRDGSAWIATSAGLTHVLPGPKPSAAPRLRIDEISFGARTLREAPREPVPWSERFLRLTLGTDSFASARAMRIEYRLDPAGAWHAAQGPVVDVGALEPGAHTLELRATGRSAVEPAGPVLRVAFEVRPPWWNSTTARMAYAAALALLWWSSAWWLQSRARARRRALEQAIAERTSELQASREALRRLGEYNARALEDERKRVSRELHDELGQQLAALRMEVSVARMRVNKQVPVEPAQLDLLLARVDRLVATVRGLVQQLRPPALDGGLTAAIEWLATEFSANTGLPCRVEVDPAVRELSPDIATVVFRVAQESLNNVRRHAQAREAALSLRQEGGEWVLAVRDDGAGFDPAHHSPGYGLLGMEERARLLGGELAVHSAPGEGTEVRLRFSAAEV